MNSGLEVCPGCFPSGYYRAGMVVLEMWILPTCKDIIRTWLALLPPCNTAVLLATQVGHHWGGVPSVWPTFHRKGAAEGKPDLLSMHRTLLSLACRQCSGQSPAAFSTIIRRVTDDSRGRLHFGSRLQRYQSTIVDQFSRHYRSGSTERVIPILSRFLSFYSIKPIAIKMVYSYSGRASSLINPLEVLRHRYALIT